MRVAVAGGTGFMGSHLTDHLVASGHDVVVISRSARPNVGDRSGPGSVEVHSASVGDPEALAAAFEGCAAVAHLAGINLERGNQTFQAVHVEGTENVVRAAEAAGVERLVLSSFLRARPDCGSGYHESKWAAEEIVRESALAETVLKIGVTYGEGDHMLTHISRALRTAPVFATIGLRDRRVCPLAVEDLVEVLDAALVDGRLAGATVPVVGPEALSVAGAARRIGSVVGRRPLVVPLPIRAHYALAEVQKWVMETPLVAPAQVRILSEGVCEPALREVCESLPEDLEPDTRFSTEQIAAHLDSPRRFGLGDLRV